jgi:hypothetical protein
MQPVDVIGDGLTGGVPVGSGATWQLAHAGREIQWRPGAAAPEQRGR